jgi:hypothetical protein
MESTFQLLRPSVHQTGETAAASALLRFSFRAEGIQVVPTTDFNTVTPFVRDLSNIHQDHLSVGAVSVSHCVIPQSHTGKCQNRSIDTSQFDLTTISKARCFSPSFRPRFQVLGNRNLSAVASFRFCPREAYEMRNLVGPTHQKNLAT